MKMYSLHKSVYAKDLFTGRSVQRTQVIHLNATEEEEVHHEAYKDQFKFWAMQSSSNSRNTLQQILRGLPINDATYAYWKRFLTPLVPLKENYCWNLHYWWMRTYCPSSNYTRRYSVAWCSKWTIRKWSPIEIKSKHHRVLNILIKHKFIEDM